MFISLFLSNINVKQHIISFSVQNYQRKIMFITLYFQFFNFSFSLPCIKDNFIKQQIIFFSVQN